MPAEEGDLNNAPVAPAAQDAAALAASSRVAIIQLWLCDLAARFPLVQMTRDGDFIVACPADAAHPAMVWMMDSGEPSVGCPTCMRSGESYVRFLNAFCARMPEWECWIRTRPPALVPATGWQRQPEGAPAVAIRRMCNGALQGIARPERHAEVLEWIRR